MVENQTIKDRLIIYIKYLKISVRKFEEKCNLANGYIKNIRLSITPEKLRKISLHYPELNTGWLMTGEGEMLKTSVTIENGDGSTQVIGDGNHVSTPSTLDKALDEIAAQRKVTEEALKALAKSQEQMSKLLEIMKK